MHQFLIRELTHSTGHTFIDVEKVRKKR
ncbi:DUF1381 domain-containing protein [Staphylococcus coagulans]